MIIIKTRKEVNGNGTLGRRILELKALPSENLPSMYLKEKGSFYLAPSGESFYSAESGGSIISKGGFYLESDFQEKKAFIERAGNILMEVNKKLEALRSAWNGEETFEI